MMSVSAVPNDVRVRMPSLFAGNVKPDAGFVPTHRHDALYAIVRFVAPLMIRSVADRPAARLLVTSDVMVPVNDPVV